MADPRFPSLALSESVEVVASRPNQVNRNGVLPLVKSVEKAVRESLDPKLPYYNTLQDLLNSNSKAFHNPISLFDSGPLTREMMQDAFDQLPDNFWNLRFSDPIREGNTVRYNVTYQVPIELHRINLTLSPDSLEE